MSEILAPAGDKNSALAAIYAGADAIYLGLKNFSARSSAENFDFDEFEDTVKLAHAFGVKVYVALNTLVKDSEAQDFFDCAIEAWNRGADALIVSDIFLGARLKRECPKIVLHLSTQAGVCNEYGAKFARDKGFSRVILSRETVLEDIKKICNIIETEVFVQGALCTCFSGQCYLSSFAGGNSGNRGKCKQPCRKLYSIDRVGFEEKSYKLSLSDLCIGEDIKTLKNAGVCSFKIEGRMRRPEYVSAAVNYYRNILENNAKSSDLSALKRTYNRGNYTKGLAFGQDKGFISSSVQGHIGEFAGIIKVQNGKYLCLCSGEFCQGDGFKILRDGKEIGGASFAGKVKGGIMLSTKQRLKNGDKAFITTDTALNQRLLSIKRQIPVKIEAEFAEGRAAEIYINGIKFVGETPLSKSVNRPLTRDTFENCFFKTDKFPFAVSFGNLNLGSVFIPASELNALRRNVFAGYFDLISQNNNVKYDKIKYSPQPRGNSNAKIAAICTNLCGVTADIGILKLTDFSADLKPLVSGFNGEKFLYLPPYLIGSEINTIKELARGFDGIYCNGIYGFELAKEINKPLFGGLGLNISNSEGAISCNAKYIALSKELTVGEAEKLSADNAFYLAAGGIKVMDLIYCPFGKKCGSCDRRELYTLTDENGRAFPLRRYKTGECRFELYNCANLVCKAEGLGAVIDCTLEDNPQTLLKIFKNEEKLREYFKTFTRGHTVQPIN